MGNPPLLTYPWRLREHERAKPRPKDAGMTPQIISGVVVGVVVAIAATFVGHLLTRSREREHWDREDRRHRETREHEWQLQHRTDRLALYRQFLVELGEITPQAGEPDPGPREKAELTMNVIQLLGSEAVRGTAYPLLIAHVNLTNYRGRVISGELAGDDPKVKTEMDLREHNLLESRTRFMDAAQKELRVDLGI